MLIIHLNDDDKELVVPIRGNRVFEDIVFKVSNLLKEAIEGKIHPVNFGSIKNIKSTEVKEND